MIWHQRVQNGYNDPSNSKSSKVLETVTSHLKGVVENIFWDEPFTHKATLKV